MPKVRLLADQDIEGLRYAGDSVPTVSAKVSKSLVAAGLADPDPAAVAYAESLGVKLPEGAAPADDDAAAAAAAAAQG